MSADELIWSVPVDYQRTQQDFAVIVEYLLITLADYLQQPIENLDDSIEKSILGAKRFTCSVRSKTEFGGIFNFGWTGLMGMTPGEEDNDIYVGTSLFLFSQNKRLVLPGNSGSYLEIAYERDENGVGCWKTLGWFNDDYGQYERYDS